MHTVNTVIDNNIHNWVLIYRSFYFWNKVKDILVCTYVFGYECASVGWLNWWCAYLKFILCRTHTHTCICTYWNLCTNWQTCTAYVSVSISVSVCLSVAYQRRAEPVARVRGWTDVSVICLPSFVLYSFSTLASFHELTPPPYASLLLLRHASVAVAVGVAVSAASGGFFFKLELPTLSNVKIG